MSEAIVVTDRFGSITWSNQAFQKMCGYTSDELTGKKAGTLLQGEQTDPLTIAELRKAVANKREIDTEILNYHKSGRPYWASISITPIKEADNSVSGFIAVERDITYLRKEISKLQDYVVELYTALIAKDERELSRSDSKDPFIRHAAEKEKRAS